VKPRKALCGGIEVGGIYDLSKPGAYRIRIDRYDESDTTPGQKLGDLPIVQSNWLTIFENPLPAPQNSNRVNIPRNVDFELAANPTSQALSSELRMTEFQVILRTS
jgi:hypothetical protein